MENPFELLNERLTRIEQLLEQIISEGRVTSDTNSNENDIFNTKQLAEYVGLTVSTIYSYTQRRDIPHYKRGKKLYFKKEEINNWIYQNKIKTNDEIKIEAENYLLNHRLRR